MIKQVGWLITYQLVFISSHVAAIVTSYMMSKFGIWEEIKERIIKNLIIVFYIEFYDFWWKPHLNRIKWRKVTSNLKNSNFPPHDHIWSNFRVFKRKNNECIPNGKKTNLHKIKNVVFLISHMWCYVVYFVTNYVLWQKCLYHFERCFSNFSCCY